MTKYTKFIYLFITMIFLIGCRTIDENGLEIKNTIEITVSCEDDSDLKKYIDEGWRIVKEYSEEKVCSWKSVAASNNCDIEKDKGCKIIKPDKIGEEKIYLLEK